MVMLPWKLVYFASLFPLASDLPIQVDDVNQVLSAPNVSWALFKMTLGGAYHFKTFSSLRNRLLLALVTLPAKVTLVQLFRNCVIWAAQFVDIILLAAISCRIGHFLSIWDICPL